MEVIIQKLTKQYGSKVALQDFNLILRPGIYGILGSNGAGKTTLMNLLTDNIARTGGDILWRGKDILEQKEAFRRKIGYMPQQQNLYAGFTVEGFLHYMAMLKGVPRRKAAQQIETLLERVNLTSERTRGVNKLSGGMKQRVLLAQALLGEPRLLILDEPTAGLDPQERIRIRNLIADISRNKIILLATHVVSDVECIADYILLMKEGRKVAYGTPYQLIAGLAGKVADIPCTKAEVASLQKQYPFGNLVQRKGGLYMRVVGDDLPRDWQASVDTISLEEVYLYHLEYLWYKQAAGTGI